MKVRGYEAHPPVSGEEQKHCARGERCAAGIPVRQDDGTIRTEGAFVYRTFCEPDRSIIVTSLEALPDYYRRLGKQIGQKAANGGEKVSGTKAPPLEIRLDVDSLMVDIVVTAASWAERVDAVADLSGTATNRVRGVFAPPKAVKDICELLGKHVDALLALGEEPMTRFMSLPDAEDLPPEVPVRRHYDAGYAEALPNLSGAEAGLELLRLNSRCRWLLGDVGADQEVPVPCWNENCGLKGTVFRPDGAAGLADYAECRACGEKYFADRYVLLMKQVYEREIAKQQVRKKAS